MNKLIKILSGMLIGLGLGLLPTISSAASEDWSFRPYLGVDAGWQGLKWDAGFGDRHFNQDYIVYNGSLGVMLHKYFGVELGLSRMQEGQRRQYYPTGAPALGFVAIPSEPTDYISEAHMNGFNASVILNYPVLKCTSLIGVVGAAWEKLYLNSLPLQTAALYPLIEWDTGTKAVLRLGVGIRQMITPNFGARLLYIWENTSRLSAVIEGTPEFGGSQVPNVPSDFFTANPRNSHRVMLGFFYQDKIG